jgi:hypothetical protein
MILSVARNTGPLVMKSLRDFSSPISAGLLRRCNEAMLGLRIVYFRIIHDAWASKLRTLVSLGYCSKFVVSTVHPRREIGEFEKPVATSAESPQAPNQTPVVVNNSGLFQMGAPS